PTLNAAGGKPSGPGVTECTGVKSTLAGNSTSPFAMVTCWTAELPFRFPSFCDSLMPNLSARSPLEASSRMYHTTRPRLEPRWSGSVTVPSPFSCALAMNLRLPPDRLTAARASDVADPGAVRLVAFFEQPAATSAAIASPADRTRRSGFHGETGFILGLRDGVAAE